MQKFDKLELRNIVEEKMRKMFFSQPVINRFFETATPRDIEAMEKILDDEQEVRRIARRARYIKTANFPTMKSFDDYDFSGIKFPNNFSRDEMLSLDFIKKKHTIVFYGGCGSGKTHATTALGINACNMDYKVKFFTLTSLVMHLKNAKNNGTLERAYKTLMNCDLICIDEWGYLPLDLESGQLLFSVISNAYERLSLIITTNLPFNEWGPLFADEQLAAAIIDRIVHYGHLVNTGVKDWRLTHALMNDR
jgi:DNA replication protein DnaC